MDGHKPGHSYRRTERRQAARAQTKKLGRVAQAAIAHNDALVEEYIAAVESGVATPYKLGVVMPNPADPDHPGTFAFGDGSFTVKVGGRFVRANLRKLLHGRGRFHHNPEVMTAVRLGTHVLIEDLGFGEKAGGVTHQIMGVLSMGQASRAVRAVSSNSRNSLAGFVFDRSSEEKRDAALRAAAIATLNRERKAARTTRRSASA